MAVSISAVFVILINIAIFSGRCRSDISTSQVTGSSFSDVNIFLLNEELDAWQDGVYTSNIANDDLESLVTTLLKRFQCLEQFGGSEELCQECSAEMTNHVCQLVDSHGSLSEEQFNEASAILFHLVSMDTMEDTCSKARWLNSTEQYQYAVLNTDGSSSLFTTAELGDILDVINNNYIPATSSKCFTAESVFQDSVSDSAEGATAEEVYGVTAMVTSYLLQGFCIGTVTAVEPHAFVDDIFEMYGDEEGVISEEEFEEMLSVLSIGGDAHEDEDEHDHEKRSALTNARRDKRALSTYDDEAHVDNVTTTCFSGEEILDIHNIDHEAGITESDFVELCPALVQQILRDACHEEESEEEENELTPEVWIYGTISVFIISLGAVVGGLIIPFLSPNIYEKFIHCMISLAIAILVGDAVIHLLPYATGVHDHGAEEDGHDHEDEAHSPLDPEMAFAWKSLACVLAVYFFLLLETIMAWWSGHSHHDHSEDINLAEVIEETSAKEETMAKSTSQMYLTENEDITQDPTSDEPTSGSTSSNLSFIEKYGPLPMMVFLGDALHNCGDGLAIGAAFTLGMGPGISTSLAVFCHEVPHELGDLAILLKSGLTLKMALLLNFLSATSAFIGLYIGIVIATTDAARQWIFAMTAGMFLYVALADMVPQITHVKGTKDPKLTFFLQNVFFLIGTAFIFLLAVYEDQITVTIG